MTSITPGPNPYSQLGSAYARAAATQPSLASVLNAADSGNPPDSNAATNLTLSDAARAQLAGTAAQKDFSAVTSEARTALDGLYAAAKVKGPIGADGNTTIDLSSFDRRALFAILTNNGGKFSLDEQKAANTELGDRFNNALAPATATAKLTGDFSSLYKAALDYLNGASGEEKATATWSALRSAVQKGVQATQQDPTTAPANIPKNDPVAAYLAQSADSVTTPAADISSVAKKVRAALDAQAKAATAAGKGSWYSTPAARPVNWPTSVRWTTGRWRRSRSIRMDCSRAWRVLRPSRRWIRATAPAFWPHSSKARPAAIRPS